MGEDKSLKLDVSTVAAFSVSSGSEECKSVLGK
jgi:hypothetical protein